MLALCFKTFRTSTFHFGSTVLLVVIRSLDFGQEMEGSLVH